MHSKDSFKHSEERPQVGEKAEMVEAQRRGAHVWILLHIRPRQQACTGSLHQEHPGTHAVSDTTANSSFQTRFHFSQSIDFDQFFISVKVLTKAISFSQGFIKVSILSNSLAILHFSHGTDQNQFFISVKVSVKLSILENSSF